MHLFFQISWTPSQVKPSLLKWILSSYSYSKKIRIWKNIGLWKNNSPMEGQFDNGKSILKWKVNSKMEKQLDYGKTIWLWNEIWFWKKNQFWNQISFFFFFFAFASMMVLLEDRQCQVPLLRASKWKKNLFLLLHPWWFYWKIDNVKSLHWGQVNGKRFLFFWHPWWSYSKIDNVKSLH